MQVQHLMTREPRTCRAEESLATAARVLWEQDCGVVPVVDAAGRPVGIVTDRDACMASYTQGKALAEIPVRIAMSPLVATCAAEEPVTKALAAMRDRKVRRLPVVDRAGAVCGILSINDCVRAAASGSLAVGDVVATLAAIGAGRQAPAAVAPPGAAATVVAPVEPRADAAVVVPARAATAKTTGQAAAAAEKQKSKAKPGKRK